MSGLLRALAEQGRAVSVGGHHPFLLDDPEAVWLIEDGRVDVYSVALTDAGEPIDRRYVLERGPGSIVYGLGVHVAPDTRTTLVGVAASGARVWALDRATIAPLLAEPAEREVAAALVEDWLRALSEGVAIEEAFITSRDALDELVRDPRLPGFDALHRAALAAIAERRARARADEAAWRVRKAESERATLAHTFDRLAGVLDGRADDRSVIAGEPDPLHGACALVCSALGLAAPPAISMERAALARDPLAAIAASVGLRTRAVALRGTWWREDHGPLVGYLVQGEARYPVALLPAGSGHYRLHDGVTGRSEPMTAERAAMLAPFAQAFYRRLPDRPLRGVDLVRFGLFGLRRELVTIVLMGLASGLLGLVLPLATGLLFDTIIPGAQRGQLLQVVFGLCVSAIAVSLFELTRGFAILRLEGKAGAALQAAVWDRLLDLPAGFFRRYTAGDLTQRAYGVDTIRRTLTASTLSSILASVFALFNAVLLFLYDASLALWAVGLVAVAVGTTIWSGARQLRERGLLAELEGRLSGLVLQLLGGIAKLRVAAAERRAFAEWARPFTEQRRIALKTRAPLAVFDAVYPIVASMVLYAALMTERHAGLSTGRFIAFVAAFSGLLSATLLTCRSALAVLGVAPAYARLRPILEAVPEIDPQKRDPGLLTGAIEVAHVSFQYSAEGPPILDDVSLRIRPGEFVAIVGPSGSGKSTLLRLLLGFEKPTTGTLYYDGQDLSGIDLREVRRQIGVVLQNGKLLSGDILTNIIGSSNLTKDDALLAAQMAGFDRDLENFPMGLHTMVSEGGATLSGGQRQRLMIARAIVRRPRILFFDEATSALDNRTQAIVAQSVEQLRATRVVIAHRLSTILNADRIVVLERGRIVQSGTYRELMAQPGPFAELARRQLA